MEVLSFSIGSITMAEPGLLVGEVQFRFSHRVNDADVTDIITVKIRSGQSGSATLSELEANLLKEAARLLDHAAQLASQETVESLRQRTIDHRRN